ncbi:hypothetical protein P8452_20641 [Trifolium repens]|nr:hypothetical protein P8452_20641 [Trifolium repens]
MKQNLELEIQQLKVSLNLLKDFKDEEDDESLQDLHELNQTLVIHGRKINDELQDARKELINSSQFSTLPFKNIGVKRMGELDIKPFIDAMKKKYNENEAEIRAFELHSLWEENIRNPNWYPFKIILTDGLAKQVIDEEDEKLDGLKKSIGKAAYDAVVVALTELDEYNPESLFEYASKNHHHTPHNTINNFKATTITQTQYPFPASKFNESKGQGCSSMDFKGYDVDL